MTKVSSSSTSSSSSCLSTHLSPLIVASVSLGQLFSDPADNIVLALSQAENRALDVLIRHEQAGFLQACLPYEDLEPLPPRPQSQDGRPQLGSLAMLSRDGVVNTVIILTFRDTQARCVIPITNEIVECHPSNLQALPKDPDRPWDKPLLLSMPEGDESWRICRGKSLSLLTEESNSDMEVSSEEIDEGEDDAETSNEDPVHSADDLSEEIAADSVHQGPLEDECL